MNMLYSYLKRLANIQNKSFFYFFLILFIFFIAGFLGYYMVSSWTSDIIEQKQLLSQLVVEKLESSANPYLAQLNEAGFFSNDSLAKTRYDRFDKKLVSITEAELSSVEGMEGGFFFSDFDEFYGYSFPTSPPPVPVFGPPPRSYNIIKDQVACTIASDSTIVNTHSFDPAIFPLTTKPLKIDGKIIGATWARIHIERDLPLKKIAAVLQIPSLIFLAILLIALLLAIKSRGDVKAIRNGLITIQDDPSFRFPHRSGIFGVIGVSINNLVDEINKSHFQQQLLERELSQQDKLATLGKLIAGVAHEVKTPLAIIKTRIQIWQREISNGGSASASVTNREEAMSIIVKEIDRLTKLVKRLLVFSKPVSDKKELLNFNKLIYQSVALLQMEQDNNVTFTIRTDESIPLISGNSNSLEQLLINILTNSVEASGSEGSVVVTTKFDKDCDEITLNISDNGSGIDSSIMDKLFDPFFTTKPTGFGLGLSIAYEIVKSHRGRISFSENFPKGIVCTIVLPVNYKEVV